MIARIKIKGFKSIKDLDIELKKINVLIGENGSGKSNFLQFFYFLNIIYNRNLQNFSVRTNIDKLFYFSRKVTGEIYGKLLFTSKTDNSQNNAYLVSLGSTDEDKFYIIEEGSGYNIKWNDDQWNYVKNTSLKESLISLSNRFRDSYLQKYFNSFRIYHFHDTSKNSALRSASEINDNRILHIDAGNLASFLYMLQKKYPKNFRLIENFVKRTVQGFCCFDLHPDRLNPEIIQLEWKDLANDEIIFTQRQLSDGSLRFIALATVFLQPNLPQVIIIDEPELGLHPFAISKLSELIKFAADKGTQVIISTQSSTLVNHFSPDDIITVSKTHEGFTIFQRLDKDDLIHWLEDYSMGELWEKNVL